MDKSRKMKRTFTIQLVIDTGENANCMAESAVCKYFEDKGWKASVAHVYPENATVIECPDVLPMFTYGS